MRVKKAWGESVATIHEWNEYFKAHGSPHPDAMSAKERRKHEKTLRNEEDNRRNRAEALRISETDLAARREAERLTEQKRIADNKASAEAHNRQKEVEAAEQAARIEAKRLADHAHYTGAVERIFAVDAVKRIAHEDIITLTEVDYNRFMIAAGRDYKQTYGAQLPAIDIGWDEVINPDTGQTSIMAGGVTSMILDAKNDRAILVSWDPERLQQIRDKFLSLNPGHNPAHRIAPMVRNCIDFEHSDSAGLVRPRLLALTGLAALNEQVIRKNAVGQDPIFGTILMNIIKVRDTPPVAPGQDVKTDYSPGLKKKQVPELPLLQIKL